MKNYTEYSMETEFNVIPENDFKELVSETFNVIAQNLRATYGPYGSSIILADTSSPETTTTKDGYNVFLALGSKNPYKKMVYLTIKQIIERVNKNVGDGTTSCILVADKLFRNLETILTTPDKKRLAGQIFDNIEKELQDVSKDMGTLVQPLKEEHFRNIISLAANYDKTLTDTLMTAFDPKFDEKTGELISKRNVIPESEVEADGNVSYKTQQLPGKYRICVEMNPAYTRALSVPTKKKVVVFDHTFTQHDWSLLTEEHDKETDVIVLATGFSRDFMDNEYLKYLKDRALVKQPVRFLIGKIHGLFVQDEVQDLSAVLQQAPWSLNTHMNVNYNELEDYDVQVVAGNCLCFDNVEAPTDYIETLKYDLKRDLTKSIAKKNHYIERIKALSMEAQDTILTVKAPTSLEAKLLSDKIDDCVSIINSAAENGVVPNLLKYAYFKLESLQDDEEDTLKNQIISMMKLSIKGLFEDIWISKHAHEEDLTLDLFVRSFYECEDQDFHESFDIIEEEFRPMKEYCTSAQYDIEVIAAAISIVKYLITSKALVFDASLLGNRSMMPME